MPRLLRSISLRLLPLLATACLLCAGCIKEDVAENTARGNFDALWRIVDEHYCFFAEKQNEYGLDWNEVYARYAAAVNDGLTDRQQFEIFGKMLAEVEIFLVVVDIVGGVVAVGAQHQGHGTRREVLERAPDGGLED